MSMFLRALSGIADVDALYYVLPDTDVSVSAVARAEKDIREHWGVDIRISLSRRPEIRYPRSYLNECRGAVNFMRQLHYAGLDHPDQVAAIHAALKRGPDAVFAESLDAMCPIMCGDGQLFPVYLDFDDIDHVRLFRSIRQPPYWQSKRLQYLTIPGLMVGERRAIRLTRKTFVCSSCDKRYLERVYRLRRLTVIPNAVELCECQEPVNEPTLLFLGSHSYPPNARASEYLINDIWPLIRSANPRARLLIAGAGAEHIRRPKDGDSRIEFLGFVEDLSALYRRTRVVCCPILSGGGTRIKILEAMAYGKPVVATTIGAEGLDLRPGREILLANGANDFAAACLEFMRDDALCREIGRAAWTAVKRAYDRAEITKRIQEAMTDV